MAIGQVVGKGMLNVGKALSKNSRVTNALIGAGTGAIVGGITGGISGAGIGQGMLTGAAVGAGVGAVGGRSIGNALAKGGVSMNYKSQYRALAKDPANIGPDGLLKSDIRESLIAGEAEGLKSATAPARQRQDMKDIRREAEKKMNGTIKEARKPADVPKEKQYTVREKKVLDGTAASTLDQYRADIGGEKVKLGFEDGRRTAIIDGGERNGGSLKITDEMWDAEVKKAMGGGDDWTVDSVLNTAQEIAETEVGDSSGIFEGLGGWIKQNPIPAAGIALGGGFVVSRLLDDD